MEDILAAGRNPNISSDIEPAYAGMGSRDALIPLHSHGSSHTAYRKLLDPLLAPKAVAYLEPHIRDLADSLIDAFVDRGHVEFHDEFAVPIAATIFLQLFGLPVTDMEFLNSTKDEILKNGGATPEARTKLSVEAGDRLRAYLNEKLDERALEAEPRDDLIGRFTTFEVDGRSLDRDEILQDHAPLHDRRPRHGHRVVDVHRGMVRPPPAGTRAGGRASRRAPGGDRGAHALRESRADQRRAHGHGRHRRQRRPGQGR